MPALLNWFLRLIPTNPICMRLVQGGSRRQRHMLIRSAYLAVMILMVLFVLLTAVEQTSSVRKLARAGADTFTWVSYLQVGLVCLLTPIFMAGAIAQEANPRTWDIMLTTPLGNLQIVLGNLFGRLFFILALLFSTLPLFAVTQIYGGVPGKSIFASYAIASSSSLLVAAIAITLCVNRTAGKRAVFWFYAIVVIYLFVTYALDHRLRVPVTAAGSEMLTTVLTPLNPFLVLDVLLRSNTYVPHNLTGTGASWLALQWFSRPISTFCWLCVDLSVVMIAYSTVRVRLIGARTGSVQWYRRMFGLGAGGAVERPARTVGHNPIAWRESVARGRTLPLLVVRWGFVAVGVGVGIGMIALFHTGTWNQAQLQVAVVTVLAAEVAVVALVAINLSATAVSREREDGTLDLILTTPIQPGPYLTGKLRGLFQYLLPLMAVPTITMILLAVYVLADGFGRSGGVMVNAVVGTNTKLSLPMFLPEGAIALPLTLISFTMFCVMIGLHWSIKSKGTISSVVSAVLVVGFIAGLVGLCGIPAGQNMPYVGAVVTAASPINLVWAITYPAATIDPSLANDAKLGRIMILVGAGLAAIIYTAIVFGMHTNMKRNFMMTVRKLAGTN
jgi:ABC-type transport system involved in multi-copper enzyme maturation permease subunit